MFILVGLGNIIIVVLKNMLFILVGLGNIIVVVLKNMSDRSVGFSCKIVLKITCPIARENIKACS